MKSMILLFPRIFWKFQNNYGMMVLKIYHSFISAKIDDYNSSAYYENPSYISESYKENRML